MRDKIELRSPVSAHKRTTTKNKRTKPEKLKIKKYDPIARKHVVYEEGKISK